MEDGIIMRVVLTYRNNITIYFYCYCDLKSSLPYDDGLMYTR